MELDDFESTSIFGEFPQAVQDSLGLEPLEEIVEASNAIGATRLLLCPDLEPLEWLTLVFFDSEV